MSHVATRPWHSRPLLSSLSHVFLLSAIRSSLVIHDAPHPNSPAWQHIPQQPCHQPQPLNAALLPDS